MLSNLVTLSDTIRIYYLVRHNQYLLFSMKVLRFERDFHFCACYSKNFMFVLSDTITASDSFFQALL